MKGSYVFQALQVRKSVCCRHDIQHDYVTDYSERLKRFFIPFYYSRLYHFFTLDDDHY